MFYVARLAHCLRTLIFARNKDTLTLSGKHRKYSLPRLPFSSKVSNIMLHASHIHEFY